MFADDDISSQIVDENNTIRLVLQNADVQDVLLWWTPAPHAENTLLLPTFNYELLK